MNGSWQACSVTQPRCYQAFAIVAALCVAGAVAAQGLVPPLVPPEMHYVIDAKVDLKAGQLTGTGSVVVRNSTKREVRALGIRWFDWRSGSYTVTVGGVTREYPSTAESIELPLTEPLKPDARLQIGFRFRRALGDLDRGFGIQRWFPQVWWGYDTHASYDVAVDAPASLIVGATGRRDTSTGRYRADHIRTFGLYLARGFELRERMAGTTLVRSIFRADMRECAETVLESAADAVGYFRQRFGMYPQASLTIIPGGSRPVGGYPYATGMVAIHGQEACAEKPRDTHWRWIATHEVGHQYWLEHVLEKEPEQAYGWLMIGLGIWSDREYARTHGMESVHPGFLSGYADAVRKGLNTTIEIAPEELRKAQFDYNTLVTHYKGFGVVSALAAIVGRETFDRIVRRCLRDYAGLRLGSAEFRRVAEEESGQDLGWFFVPLLRTNRFASYAITDTATAVDRGTYTSRIAIANTGDIRLPVPVEVRFRNGERKRHTLDRARDEQVLTFIGTAALDSVTIDPDHEFPLVIPAPEVTAARLAELVSALPWTGGGGKPLRLYTRAVELGINDAAVLRKLGLTLADSRHYEEALDAFSRMMQADADSTSPWHFGGLVWRGMLNDLLGRRSAALESYRQALAIPGNPRLQHTQFTLTLDRAWVEERLRTPFSWR